MSWDQPTACKLTDPKVVANNSPSTVTLNYLKPIIDWIDSQPSKFNGKNYMEGFSQNAATTAYLSLCLHDKITGFWTGGLPKDYEKGERWNGTAWPCFSKNGPIIACGGIYSNDRYLKSSGGIEGRNESYDMMLKEGHDPRVFIFKGPSTDKTIGGSHNTIRNRFHWYAGCWGINPNCNETCEQRFFECMNNANVTTAAVKAKSFSSCMFSLDGLCSECTPTFAMLEKSEDLVFSRFESFGAPDASLPHEQSDESHCVMPSLWDNE